MGGCLAPFWQEWARLGAEDWVVQVLREGYRIPFMSPPPLSSVPIHLPSYSPNSIRGRALASEIVALSEKGALEPAPPTPGYYSRVFVAAKASGAWRPIIDLSRLNVFVEFSRFHMETPQSVLRSIRPTGLSPWICRTITCRFLFLAISLATFVSWCKGSRTSSGTLASV